MLHWESNPCLSHMVDQSSPQALVHVLHACTIPTYRRSTIFHCDLIFVPAGRGKNENKHENIQHNTKQWYRNAFSGPKLENKNCEQLKHRNIMNEILWIYGTSPGIMVMLEQSVGILLLP